MKTSKRIARLIIAGFLINLTMPAAVWAQSTWFWDGGGADNNWSTLDNWGTTGTASTSTPGALPGSLDNVIFYSTNATRLTSSLINQAFSIRSLTFGNSQSGAVTIGGASALTIGSGGLTVNSGFGAVNLSAPITLGAAQTWTNSSANTLTIETGGLSLGNNVLTLTGAGNMTISAAITGGATSGLVRPVGASGTLRLTGANTYTGTNTFRGVVEVSTLANGGVASSIGASTSAAGNLIFLFNDGALTSTLRYIGTSDSSTDRLISFGGSNNNGRTFTLDVAAGAGKLSFTNTGAIVGSNNLDGLFFSASNTGVNTFAVLIGTNILRVGSPLSKVGSGEWQFTNSNTYANPTAIGAGTLGAAVLANGGVASSIGASTNAASNLVFGAPTATLKYIGSANATTDRGFTMSSGAGGGATLDASGAGSITFDNTVAIAYGTTNQTRVLTLTGTSTATNVFGKVLANNGTGATSLVKNGTGLWRLTGANTYTGPTTISAGVLEIGAAGQLASSSAVTINGGELKYNGSTALTSPITFTQGTISGTGAIGTAVIVGTGDTISPGNSPGIQSYTSGLTWAAGGTYLWEINDWTGAAGTAFDQVAVTGALGITALTDTNANRYRILITSLSGTSAGNVSNFDGTVNRSFPIATYTTISGFDASKFWLDTTAFTNTYSGSFTISDSGTAVMLNYIAPGPAYVSTTYTLAATAGASAIRVNGTTGITATVTNTGTGTADSLAVTGLGVSVTSPGSVTISPNSGTAANTNGNVVGSGTFTGSSAGAYTFTPSASGTNVNLGTAASLTSTGSTTVTVYNPAAATTSGSVNLGTVIVGSTSAWSQAISITNSAPTGGFSESLNAAFGALSGVTTNSGSFNLLAAGGTNNTAMVVALSTGSVGNLSGSAQLTFQTDGQGTSGLAAAALNPQTVNVYGTVLDHATSSLAGTLLTSTTISLGTWDYSTTSWQTGSGTGVFSIYNIASSFGAPLTADLSLLSVSGSANGFSTNLNTDSDIAGGSSQQFSIFADTTGWTTSGTQTVTFTISTSDKTSVAGAAASNTLTVIANVVVVPEPATIAMAGIAAACAGFVAYRRRRPTT